MSVEKYLEKFAGKYRQKCPPPCARLRRHVCLLLNLHLYLNLYLYMDPYLNLNLNLNLSLFRNLPRFRATRLTSCPSLPTANWKLDTRGASAAHPFTTDSADFGCCADCHLELTHLCH